MTATQSRPGGLDPNARGILVLVAFVAIGALLLWQSGGGKASSASPAKTSGTTTTTISITGDTSVTTTEGSSGGTTHSPASVNVIVLNGSGKAGVAKSNSTNLGTNHGYHMLPPGNATANIPATTVYYATGYQLDAASVANDLGVAADNVKAKPGVTLGAGVSANPAATANVVVVLGANVSSVSSGTTTTTTG